MKKAEAISILAASVRPREAKDRARYDEAVRMAIEALKCSETPKSSEQNAETAQADHIADTGRKVEQTAEIAQNVQNEDLISRKMAIDTLEKQLDYLQMLNKDENPKAESKWYGVNWARNVIADLPSAQPQIIRCKDCKHRDKYGCCKYWKGLAMGDIPIATDDYDFCSYAKRI